ncbi:hypothetical protein ElyMa_001157800 [Elysia marginata]|uniref:Uncharacterized protein n=1 Tax=Elysia marginata TaxID=1093978 RepID=A0AAV4I2R9_9GAST|nr:hypothetical protein ElyMa_001157800 [Elysia marginata]
MKSGVKDIPVRVVIALHDAINTGNSLNKSHRECGVRNQCLSSQKRRLKTFTNSRQSQLYVIEIASDYGDVEYGAPT